MITCMSEMICVTNRLLCRGDLIGRIEDIAKCRPCGIILREKDLPAEEYLSLAERVYEICEKYGVRCILHSFAQAAVSIGCDNIHMPLPMLKKMTEEGKARFTHIGASCHSLTEAQEAVEKGADYLIAGHIFATDCKKGLPGRGTDFLREICSHVDVPVYAIGGITPDNISEVLQTGAKGVCVMSGIMQCSDVSAYLAALGKDKMHG